MGALQGVEQIAQLAQCLHGSHGCSHGEVSAFGIKHPTGKGTEGVILPFASEIFSVSLFPPPKNAERLSKERMPTVVNGGGLKM